MVTYKTHHACFSCRKTFKRRLLGDIYGKGTKRDGLDAKCPECGNVMADMGYDFKSPKSSDTNTWKVMEGLYELGQTFYSCGCSGPGYRPRDINEYREYLQRMKGSYEEALSSWHKNERAEDRFKARQYWQENLDKVNKAISAIKMSD